MNPNIWKRKERSGAGEPEIHQVPEVNEVPEVSEANKQQQESLHFSDFDLAPLLLQGLEASNLTQPTEVQAQCIPLAFETQDILVQAPTGTGKTLAYLLPALEFLIQFPEKTTGPRVLVLVPTRELARQVFKDGLQLVQSSDIRLASVAGGESYGEQLRRLDKEAPALLIATPGRLLRVLAEEDLSLEFVELLVLDEADRMLDMGFGRDILDILALIPAKPRIFLFSATLGEFRVASFASQVLKEPLEVQVGRHRSLPAHIKQLAYLADSLEHKFQLLAALVAEQTGLMLVFGYSRERCQRIQSWLMSQGIASQTLHGEVAQKDRNRIAYRFIQGEIPVLVVTDLAARGLHLPGVMRVIHFDLPRSAEIYIHRSGRTGRNGQPGEALLLTEAHDAQLLGRIERYQRLAIKRTTLVGLEPKHREPVFSRKKKKPKAEDKKEPKPRVKNRWRDTKNKGKPKPKVLK